MPPWFRSLLTIDWSSFLQILFNGLLAFFTYKLWDSTKKLWLAGEKQLSAAQQSITVAKESAETTRKMVKTMEDTAERELRAYVFLESSEMFNVLSTTSAPRVILVFKNFGQTPAYEAIHWISGSIAQFPLADSTSLISENQLPEKFSIAPDGTFSSKATLLRCLTPQEVDRLKNGTDAVYIFGKISYKDVFEKNRWIKYMLYVHRDHITNGTFENPQSLPYYKEGNFTDETNLEEIQK